MSSRLLIIAIFIACISLNTEGQTTLRHFMQLAPTPENAVPYGNNIKAGRYVNVGDAKIYFEVYGKGQPLLMLHGGIFGSTFEMHQLIDSLSKRFQVIAVSTRGHGKSELGSKPMSYFQRAEDALAVINEVAKDSVIVYGFSDGGFTAFHLASLHPEKVKKMIIMGACEIKPGDRNVNVTVESAMKLDSFYVKQQLGLMPEPGRLQEMFIGIAEYFNKQLVVDERLLNKIKCPVLLMAGDKDAGVPLQRLVNTVGMINHCHLSVLPNCGHTAFLDNFPAFWESMVPFLHQ